MELRHLRYFLAVAEHGTVTAAAARLHVAQPAISRQLQRLEHDLGVSLFDRQGPRLTLTDAGRHMLGIASDIVARAEGARMAAQQIAKGHLARVSVAAANTTIEYVLAPFTATLDADDPFISVVEVASEAVHDAVLGGHDLGLAATRPPASRLAWTSLTSVPLRAYVAREHEWASRRTITLGDLSHAPLLLPTRADPTRLVFDEAINRAGLQYRSSEEVESPPLRQALAASNRGVAVVTDLDRFGARPLLIVDHAGNPVLLPIHACWNPAHYAASSLSAFAEQLKRFSDSVVRQAAERIREPAMSFAPSPLSGSKTAQYQDLAQQAKALVDGEHDRIANAANLSSLVYHSLPDLNWVGFYFFDGTELVVGPFQGQPACVRISLDRGVCGAAARSGQTQRVDDVHAVADHIACDANTKSELVVPLIRHGNLIGVFDLDSPLPCRFGGEDQQGLEAIAEVFLGALTT